MGGSIFSVGNTSKPNINSSNAGPTEIKTGQPFDKAEFERLNQEKDIHSGKFKPAEAYAAVEIQNSLGGQLTRIQDSDGSLADYIFTSGPNKGKTVDFMFTTANGTVKEIDGMNKFFNNNLAEILKC